MHARSRFDIEVRIPCDHDEPCVIDRFSADDRTTSTRQLAAVLESEPARMVRRRRIRTADIPLAYDPF